MDMIIDYIVEEQTCISNVTFVKNIFSATELITYKEVWIMARQSFKSDEESDLISLKTEELMAYLPIDKARMVLFNLDLFIQ